MFEIINELKNYEWVCKKRGSHEPMESDAEDFVKII